MEVGRKDVKDKVRVLIVEDAPMSRVALQTMLEELGCDVVSTANGQEAVNRFDSSFQLIFIDYNMPVMKGDEAVKLMRQMISAKPSKTPVYIVVLTADNSEKINQICLNAGVNKIVEKPIRPEILKIILNELI